MSVTVISTGTVARSFLTVVLCKSTLVIVPVCDGDGNCLCSVELGLGSINPSPSDYHWRWRGSITRIVVVIHHRGDHSSRPQAARLLLGESNRRHYRACLSEFEELIEEIEVARNVENEPEAYIIQAG